MVLSRSKIGVISESTAALDSRLLFAWLFSTGFVHIFHMSLVTWVMEFICQRKIKAQDDEKELKKMYLTKIRLVLLGRSAGGIATLFTHFWFTHRILDSRLLSGFIVSHRCRATFALACRSTFLLYRNNHRGLSVVF